jgi:hypothetical protein
MMSANTRRHPQQFSKVMEHPVWVPELSPTPNAEGSHYTWKRYEPAWGFDGKVVYVPTEHYWDEAGDPDEGYVIPRHTYAVTHEEEHPSYGKPILHIGPYQPYRGPNYLRDYQPPKDYSETLARAELDRAVNATHESHAGWGGGPATPGRETDRDIAEAAGHNALDAWREVADHFARIYANDSAEALLHLVNNPHTAPVPEFADNRGVSGAVGGIHVQVHPAVPEDPNWHFTVHHPMGSFTGVVPPRTGRRVLHEMTDHRHQRGVRMATERYPIDEAEHMHRTGQPIRLSLEAIQNLHAAIGEDPHNLRAWGEMTDALEDIGKTTTAVAMRDFLARGEARGTGAPNDAKSFTDLHHPDNTTLTPLVSRLFPRESRRSPSTHVFGGLPLEFMPSASHFSSGSTATHYFVRLAHPTLQNPHGPPGSKQVVGGFFVDADTGDRMMAEADHPPQPAQPAQPAQPHQLSRGASVLRSLLIQARTRQALRLAKDAAPDSNPHTFPEGLGSTYTKPEQDMLGKMKGKTLDDLIQYTNESRDPGMHPFEGTIPHHHTITTLAQFGTPARGEYKRSNEIVHALFGHDEHGPAAWIGVNAVLSPQAAYLEHASAASLIVANWLADGKPRDEGAIREIVRRAHMFGRHFLPENITEYGEDHYKIDPKTGKRKWGRAPVATKGVDAFGATTSHPDHIKAVVRVLQNVEDLKEALENPASDAGKKLSLLTTDGLLKVANFGVSYMTPFFGGTNDVHMSRLMFHPDLVKEFDSGGALDQLYAHLVQQNHPDAKYLSSLKEASLKQINVNSELVKMMMQHSDMKVVTKNKKTGKTTKVSLAAFMKAKGENMVGNKSTYYAYKEALAHAARTLGWTSAEVQESVWTGVVAIMAANALGIPHDKILHHLTEDAVRKGWQSHEAFVFPGVVHALGRSGVSKATIDREVEKSIAAATARSRPGVIQVGDPAHLAAIAPHIAPGSGRGAYVPIVDTLKDSLKGLGIYNPKTGKMELRRPDDPARLAQYDRGIDLGSALQRANSANHAQFVQHLHHVLEQAGVRPDKVYPAIHDMGNDARVSAVALGRRSGPQTPHTAAAWAGLLGRQPGMLAFSAHPQGRDSIYTFSHTDANAVRQAMDGAGVASRVLVPQQSGFQVYVFDKGRSDRKKVASALGQLGSVAQEWVGNGETVGGNDEDMGRAQYRDQINQSEKDSPAQMRRPGRPIRLSNSDIVSLINATRDSVDHAPALVLSDRLEDAGMEAHARVIRGHVEQNPDQPSHYNADQVRQLIHDSGGRGDLVRFLLLHPGRFAINRYTGNRVVLHVAGNPLRTKKGTIRKNVWPTLQVWETQHPTKEAADQHVQELLHEGAIGTHPTQATNWPERGVGMEPKEMFDRSGNPIRLATPAPGVNTKAPWDMTPDEARAAGVSYFRTGQGSLYAHANGQTIRLKSPHQFHETADVGLKRGSHRTYFVHPQDATQIGMWQSMQGASGKRVVIHNGHAHLVSVNAKTGTYGRDGQPVKLHDAPAEGLSPFELTDPSSRAGEDIHPSLAGGVVYKGTHPGSPITEFPDHTKAHSEMLAGAQAAGKVAAPQKPRAATLLAMLRTRQRIRVS